MHTIISDMLLDGRSICYTPSNYNNTIDDLERQISTRYPSTELLAFCIEQSIQIVPVVIQGEHERYRIIEHPWLRTVQSWFYKKIDYCLPLVFWMRFRPPIKPPPLTLSFGSILDSYLYANAEKLTETIREKVSAMTVPALRDKIVKPQ
jgi:hypothetical protein